MEVCSFRKFKRCSCQCCFTDYCNGIVELVDENATRIEPEVIYFSPPIVIENDDANTGEQKQSNWQWPHQVNPFIHYIVLTKIIILALSVFIFTQSEHLSLQQVRQFLANSFQTTFYAPYGCADHVDAFC